MKGKTYILSIPLAPESAIARIEILLAKAGVQYRTKGFSILSISTPVALLSIQRVLYSNRNWFGLNPFTFISGVDVRCRSDKSSPTEIIVQVSKFRTFLWVAVYVVASASAGLAAPQPVGAILFIAGSLAAWFGLVSFLGGYLIKKEIMGCLCAQEASHR